MILDADQQRALRVLRYWFGPVEVLGVEGVPGDTSPGVTGQQLALPIPEPGRSNNRGSSGNVPGSGAPTDDGAAIGA
jgi:hypothetical protein